MTSTANGSRFFGSGRIDIVRILTISLFSLGALAAALYAYQQATEPPVPDLISKEEAVQIALNAGEWDKWDVQKSIGEMQIGADLVHVQPNGFGLKVDEKTLQDTPAAGGRFDGYENRYLWDIDIFGPDIYGNKNTSSLIDAETGDILSQYPESEFANT
ncbi:MAG: hypothetical protein HRF40_13295 [Nitrososphaera sp.]